jgi:hypothetical protein
VAGAFVRLVDDMEDLSSHRRTLTRADGRFSIGFTEPPPARLLVSHDRHGVASLRFDPRLLNEPPTVTLAPACRLEATIVPAAETTLWEYFALRVERLPDGETLALRVQDRDELRQAFPALPPGRHRLVLTGRDRRTWYLRSREVAIEVDLHPDRDCRVELREPLD